MFIERDAEANMPNNIVVKLFVFMRMCPALVVSRVVWQFCRRACLASASPGSELAASDRRRRRLERMTNEIETPDPK